MDHDYDEDVDVTDGGVMNDGRADGMQAHAEQFYDAECRLASSTYGWQYKETNQERERRKREHNEFPHIRMMITRQESNKCNILGII